MTPETEQTYIPTVYNGADTQARENEPSTASPKETKELTPTPVVGIRQLNVSYHKPWISSEIEEYLNSFRAEMIQRMAKSTGIGQKPEENE